MNRQMKFRHIFGHYVEQKQNIKNIHPWIQRTTDMDSKKADMDSKKADMDSKKADMDSKKADMDSKKRGLENEILFQ